MQVTPLRMAEQIKERLRLSATPEQVYRWLTPSGELAPLTNAYLRLFWRDVLPTEVAEPKVGDLRRGSERMEVWNGEAWV